MIRFYIKPVERNRGRTVTKNASKNANTRGASHAPYMQPASLECTLKTIKKVDVPDTNPQEVDSAIQVVR